MREFRADALILAGGRNSRMEGRYKGDLELCGRTFIDRVIRELKQVSVHLYLSYGEDGHGEKEGCAVVRDLHPGCGPISGLEAGLSACVEPYLFTAACDMPYLQAEYYRMLAGCGEEQLRKTGRFPDCIVPVTGGRADVLAAVYGKNALPVIRELIREKIYRPRAVFDRVDTLYVPLEPGSPYARMLRNINTPEEYRATLEETRQGEAARNGAARNEAEAARNEAAQNEAVQDEAARRPQGAGGGTETDSRG